MTRTNVAGPFRVDLGSFPLMCMGAPNVAQYDHPSAESFFDCIEQGLSHDQPFVILLDARGVPHADEVRRRDFLRLLELHRSRIERLVVAYAVICGSPLERGLVTAFMWFIRLPMPIRIFTNEVEAKAWLMSRMEEAREQPLVEAGGFVREQNVEAGGFVREQNGNDDPDARDSGIIYSSRRSSAS